MEPEGKYLFVGASVMIGVTLIAAAIFWLSEAGRHGHADYYSVYFAKQTLNGLQYDSAVTMKGIRVGSVLELHISQKNIELVRVLLRLDGGTPVKTDTRAVINRNLLTGLANIDLINSTQDAHRLTQILPGEDYPVIPEGQTELHEIAASLPQLVHQVGQIVGEVQALLSEENRQAVSKTLANLERISRTIAERDKELSSLITDMQQAAHRMTSVGESLEEFARNMSRSSEEVRPKLMETLESLSGAVATIDAETARLSTAFSTTADLMSQDIQGVSQKVGSVAGKVSSAAEAFEDPRSLLAGPPDGSLGPGEGRTP